MSQNDHFYQKINKRKSDGQKDELMARGTRLYIQIHVFTFIVWWVFHGQGHKESGKKSKEFSIRHRREKELLEVHSARTKFEFFYFKILKITRWAH